MEKKKAIKIATATAIAASAFTAVAPTQSEAATSLTSQIKTAKATIKKPYDTYIKATKTPATYTTVKNQIAAAKKAKASINAAIKKAKLTTKQKNAYYAQVKAYDVYITRAQNYVNALNISVVDAKNQLATAIASGTDADKLAKQTALKTKIAQFKTAVAKVYGKDVRSLLLSYYVTPAQKLVDSVVFEVKIESVSALDDTNKYLQIKFSNKVSNLQPSDIEIKDAKKGDHYGVNTVKLSSDGKTATVELYENTDATNVLQYLTDYTVTVNANGQTLAYNFNRAAFLDQRVLTVNTKDREFTISDGVSTGASITIKVRDDKFKDFNFEAVAGEKVRVWYNKDNELINFEIPKSEATTDAIEVTKNNEIKLLSTGKKYDTSTETFKNVAAQTKFAFYVDGVRKDASGVIPDAYKNLKFNYAKIGYDKSGKIEYVRAYNLKNFVVVDRVEGKEVVGLQGKGTGGSFDVEDAVIIKDGKTIDRSEIKKGDVVFFYNYASGQSKKDRFAVVLNKSVTGTVDSVYDKQVTISGKTYDFEYDPTITGRFQFDYGKAVYVDDTNKTDYIDSDAAKELQAGGQVTAYFDLAGNLVYVAGKTAAVESSTTTGILTDSIVGDNSFAKDSIQIDVIQTNGKETVKDVKLDNLDKIKIDGVEYKIDNTNPSSDKYQAVLKSDGAASQTLVIFSAAQNPASYAAGTPSTYVTKVQLDQTEGQVVKFSADANGNLNKLELFTQHANGTASPANSSVTLDQGTGLLDVVTSPTPALAVGSKQLKAGDKYAVTGNGSKQLSSNTPVFDAKDGFGHGFDAKDINITTWGQYNGSDINLAKVVYNEDNEVVAVIILDSASNTKTYEEAVVTNVLRNTDQEVVSVDAYVNGKKQTFTVDKVSSDIKKGSTAVFQFDDNSTLVQDIYTATHDTIGEFAGRTSGLTQKTVATDAVDVGNRTVTIGTKTYKFAADGAVLDGNDPTDISLKSLTDLRGKSNVTLVLDENDSNGFVKFFIYNDKLNDFAAPAVPTITAADASVNATEATSVTISGTAEAGSTVALSLDDAGNAGTAPVIKTVTAAADGTYTTTVNVSTLTDGTITVTGTAKDAANNTSAAATATFTLDKTVAAATEDGTANKAGTTQAADFNILVNAETGAKVTAKIGATNVLKAVTDVTAAAGKATLPIDITKLATGANAIDIVVTDAAGNVSTKLTVNVTK